MADVFDRTKRSDVMSRIRSSGNKETELELIRIFRVNRIIGWRRNWPVEGKPDFVFPKQRLAVFVDGCFWHHCPIHGTKPSSNQSYWQAKLQRNMARDRLVTRTLKKDGWLVLRLWQHDLTSKNQARTLRRLERALLQVIYSP